MLGWLIYDRAQCEKNEWFINKFTSEFDRLGVSLKLKILEDGIDFDNLPDFAVVRTINPSLSKRLEDNGVLLFNNALTAETANDKYKTYQLCERLQIDVMQTVPVALGSEKIGFPLVAKSLNGHGGSQVFLIENQLQFSHLLDTVNTENFIAQKVCDEPGKDMRVYVLAGKVLVAILRTSTTDFRSNFSLGGVAQVAEVVENQREIVDKIYEALKFDFVGIDFIRNNGKWVLNEIEDVVGSRMIYKCTNIDVIRLYANYIIEKIKNY